VPALTTVITHATGDVFPATDWNTYVRDDLNYIITAGADLAAVAAANTLAVTNEFHNVTLAGGGTIDNLDAATFVPVKGQQYRLLFQNAQTIRNHGGGTGNIRTLTGIDRAVTAGELCTFTYDSAAGVFREFAPSNSPFVIFRDTTAVTIASSVAETDILGTASTGISIPGGLLSTNRKLRLWIFWDRLNNSGVGALYTAKMYYGGTSWSAAAGNYATSGNHAFGLSLFELMNTGATGAQVVAGAFDLSQGLGPFPVAGGSNVGSVDSTVAQNFRLTMTLGASAATLTFKKISCIVEVV
jgi:hypothetical protein